MLVLSRHTSERIILDLGDGRIVEVVPVSLSGDKVRLGIEAPQSVKIHREEIYEQIISGQHATEKVICNKDKVQELAPAA